MCCLLDRGVEGCKLMSSKFEMCCLLDRGAETCKLMPEFEMYCLLDKGVEGCKLMSKCDTCFVSTEGPRAEGEAG